MGATQPENAADDAGPESTKGAQSMEPVGGPGADTDETNVGTTPDEDDPATVAARKRDRAEHFIPGEYPADDPDETGEDRFDAG